MKPLTQDERWLLDQKVAEGQTIDLWLVWDRKLSRYINDQIVKIRLTPDKLLYVNDDPSPLRGLEIQYIGHNVFTNYWHAYAWWLHRGEER